MNHLARIVVVFTVGRLILNMTQRFVYPFIPAIALRLAAPVSTVQFALAVGRGVGIFSPIFSPLSERYGRKVVMVGSMALMAAVSLFGVVFTHIWIFAFIIVAYGVAKVIFDPAMQAYVGDRIPFANRARAWGVIELSWSGALFVSAPLTGFLLDVSSLQVVFLLLFVLLALATGVIWRYLPGDAPVRDDTLAPRPRPNYWQLVRSNPIMLAALGFTLCILAGQEIFFINYGLWMQQSFDLEITALGLVTVVIGLAEVVGEVTLSVLGDRVGKWRLALISALFTALCFGLLPHTSINLVLALAGMFVLFVFLETAIIASITLFTEVLPTARSLMMSANLSAASLGRLLGAILGSRLLAWTGDFALLGAVTMGIVLIGCGLMWWLRSVE